MLYYIISYYIILYPEVDCICFFEDIPILLNYSIYS